jgi:hypothetical protein
MPLNRFPWRKLRPAVVPHGRELANSNRHLSFTVSKSPSPVARRPSPVTRAPERPLPNRRDHEKAYSPSKYV